MDPQMDAQYLIIICTAEGEHLQRTVSKVTLKSAYKLRNSFQVRSGREEEVLAREGSLP